MCVEWPTIHTYIIYKYRVDKYFHHLEIWQQLQNIGNKNSSLIDYKYDAWILSTHRFSVVIWSCRWYRILFIIDIIIIDFTTHIKHICEHFYFLFHHMRNINWLGSRTTCVLSGKETNELLHNYDNNHHILE